MLALPIPKFDITHWTTWAALGAGIVVTFLVLGFTRTFRRWRWRRRLLSEASLEEDLDWQTLLNLLEKRNRDRAAAGLPPERVTDEELAQLIASLPPVPNANPLEWPEDREFQLVEGINRTGRNERRASRRRWGNPTDVHLFSTLWEKHVHGLVVNRSTGGIGIFTDKEVPEGTPLQVRAAESPSYVPAVKAEVRHCLKAGKAFVLGCQFLENVPWNARVWFG
jgi:hypothetical protein